MAPYKSDVVTAIIAAEVDRQGRGTQARLARDVGVREQTVNKWVQHQTCPEPEKWDAIERSLGLEHGRLAFEAGFAPAEPSDLGHRMDQIEAGLREVNRLLGTLTELVAELRDTRGDAAPTRPARRSAAP